MTTQEIAADIERLGPWFYEFDLGGCRTKSTLPEEVQAIFSTRLAMVNGVVERHFGARLPEIRCIDVGCHEGFYSVSLAEKGAAHVMGVDVRARNVEKARFVADALNLNNVEYRRGNCEELDASELGRFELCLFLGLLYHLENPMRCLRNISAVTKELCVVETQVINDVAGKAEWGAREWTRDYEGVMALIDESDEFYAENTETGASPVAMCPSPRALEFMLKHAGFREVAFVDPPSDAYEQHQRRKRVVCAALK